MHTVTFEIYSDGFFLELSVETRDLNRTVSNLRAMPNVRNIKF